MLPWLLLLAFAAAALFLTSLALSRDVGQLPPGGNKLIERWFSALCAIPWLVIIGAYMEACAARLVSSRWPRPMFDDPKQLVTAPLHLVFQVLLLSLGVAIPVLIVFALWNWPKILIDWWLSLPKIRSY